MYENTKDQLHFLHGDYGWFTIRALWPNERVGELKASENPKIKLNKSYQCKSLTDKDIDFWHKLNDEGYGIHVTINSSTRSNGTEGRDIDACNVLVVDFDAKEMFGNEKTDEWDKLTLEYVNGILDDKDFPPPSRTIHSGFGFHIYWKLAVPTPKNYWKDFQDRIARTLGGDQGIIKPSGTLRLNGFNNTKYPDDIRECVWIKSEADLKRENLSGDEHEKLDQEQMDTPGEQVTFLREYLLSNFETLVVPQKYKAKKRCGTGRLGWKHDYDWSKVDVRKECDKRNWKFEPPKENEDYIHLHCVHAKEKHTGGVDQRPSMRLNFRGDYNGIYSCGACKSSGTLVDLIALHDNHNTDKYSKRAVRQQLEEKNPGFCPAADGLDRDYIISAGTPKYSQEKFCNLYYTGESDSGQSIITIRFGETNAYWDENTGDWAIIKKSDKVISQIEKYAGECKMYVALSPKEMKQRSDEIECELRPFHTDTKKVIEIHKSLIRNNFTEPPRGVDNPPYWLTDDPNPDAPRPKTENILSLRNGWLDIADFDNIELRTKTPDLFNFSSAPFDIDPKNPPPRPEKWFKLCEEWLDGDEGEMLEAQKRAGYYVFAKCVSMKIIWQLIGGGSSGRTTFGKTICKARGMGEVCELVLDKMIENYGMAEAEGAGIYWIDNAEWGMLKKSSDQSKFSSIANSISGRTSITIRKMQTDPYPYLATGHILQASPDPCPYSDMGGQRKVRTYYTRFPGKWATDDIDAKSPNSSLEIEIESMIPGIIWHYLIPGYIAWKKTEAETGQGTSHLKSSADMRQDVCEGSQPLQLFRVGYLEKDTTKSMGWKVSTEYLWNNGWLPFVRLNNLLPAGDKQSWEYTDAEKKVKSMYDNLSYFSKQLSLQESVAKKKIDKVSHFIHVKLVPAGRGGDTLPLPGVADSKPDGVQDAPF